MAKWIEYLLKKKPADEDMLMLEDAETHNNKRVSFSGIADWLIEKMKKNNLISGALRFKGSSAYAALPGKGAAENDYYYCSDGDGTHGPGYYAWNGSSWIWIGNNDKGIDKSLKVEGAAAEAAATGEAIASLKEDKANKITYLEYGVNVTNGERGYQCQSIVDLSQPIYIVITPKTTNTFNVFLTHGTREVQFLTSYTINGGESYTWEFNSEFIDAISQQYGKNTYDDEWRINIRNATNSMNYFYSIYIKENERVEKNNCVYVSSLKIEGTFSLPSSACNYMQMKHKNEPCCVYIKNGIYIEKLTDNFPYAPINIADSMISVIGESRDNVIINITNSNTKQNRIMHIGGFQTVKNITMHVFADETYKGNNGNNPYVIHNDDTYNEYNDHYTTTVENCVLYSECSSPVGAGLHGKQTQIYKDVTCIYNSKYDNQQGALYIHGASNEGQIPDGVIIDGCIAISKNGALALAMPSVTSFVPYTETPTTIRRTILATSGSAEVATDFKATHKMTNDSKLNSNAYINI